MERVAASHDSKILFTVPGVWLALAAVQAAVVIGFGTGSTPWWQIAVLRMTSALVWTAITLGVRSWDSRVRDRARPVALFAHIIGLCVAALIDIIVMRAMSQAIGMPLSVSLPRAMLYYADITTLSYILSVWLARVIDAREAIVAQTRHELALRSQLARARLSYLHAQLQPHFLFNALGAVSELIFENPSAAIKTFGQLGSVLRAAASRDAEEIPLREEVAGLVPYLDVQRTRFSDWLAIELDIEPAAEDLRVPPLVLQPLVENSIRHGLRGRSSRGEVSITARVRNDMLVLSVRDNGVGLNPASTIRRTGVGLSNTEERLLTLYGTAGTLRLYNDELGGAVAEVCIPARTGSSPAEDVETAPPAETVGVREGFARRHPVLALIAGSLLAGILWTQQSYAYLWISGRLGDTTLLELGRQDFILIAMWGAMVPIIVFLARRLPLTGERWVPVAVVHLLSVVLLALAHSWGAFMYRTGGVGTGVLSTFRGSIAITLLLYLGVVAYVQRRMLEDWLAARQLATLRLNADITEAKIAAATMSVDPESLAATMLELECYARENPLRAEQAIARLGSELRATLEGGFAPSPTEPESGDARALRREDRVERLAMGA